MQGCPLRCKYCHNPDSWKYDDGKVITTEDIFSEILKYRVFLDSGKGGVTVSGGEPLLQKNFVAELFRMCQEKEIHTALDTAGYVKGKMPVDLLEVTDLVLLDLKTINSEIHKYLTGVELEPVLNFAKYLSQTGKKLWIRHVLVPGITDRVSDVEKLADFIASLQTVELVEILPFHKFGEYKWHELGYNYLLEDILPPTEDEIANVLSIIRSRGIEVR